MNSIRKFALPICIFIAGVATTIVAQTLGDIPQRTEQKRGDLAGAPGMEVITSMIEFKLGESLDLHTHHGIEVAYVIQGTKVQSPGKEPIELATASNLLVPRDLRHGGFKVVGDTSLKLFTVHIVDKGKPIYEFVK